MDRVRKKKLFEKGYLEDEHQKERKKTKFSQSHFDIRLNGNTFSIGVGVSWIYRMKSTKETTTTTKSTSALSYEPLNIELKMGTRERQAI